jgi:hypothetical protein
VRKAIPLVVLALAGCGAGAHPSPAPKGSGAQARSAGGQPPAARPRRTDPAALAVIKGWATTLRHGDVQGAARYFALPSLLINGPGQDGEPFVTAIRSFSQAVSANASLPCGAELISTRQYGHYVNALFRLTDRSGPGGGCGSGVGSTARTNFLIKRGRIVEWIRAANQPGDNGGAGTSGLPPRV